MTPALWLFASWLVRLWCAITLPSSFACPVGMSVEGVRPSGHTACLSPAISSGEECARRQPCDLSGVEVMRVHARIYCGDAEQPLVMSHRRVQCRPMRARS
jgi:hypothetical protein